MIKLALIFTTLAACAVDQPTASVSQEACQLDPNTGMCPVTDADRIQHTRSYGRSLYPTALQVDAWCERRPGAIGCIVTLDLDAVLIDVVCIWSDDGDVWCTVGL